MAYRKASIPVYLQMALEEALQEWYLRGIEEGERNERERIRQGLGEDLYAPKDNPSEEEG